MTNMREIAFETINNKYSWGKYGEFRVIIDMENSYINATNLCGLAKTRTGKKKELFHWMETEPSKVLIEKVCSSLALTRDEVLIVPTNVSNDLRGTYCHPKLIPHIASWASIDFALMVSDIVNAKIVSDAICAKDKVIVSLEARIAELMASQNTIIKKIDDMHEETISAHADAAEAREELEEQRIELINTHAQVNDISVKLGVVVEDRVVRIDRARDEVCVIYRAPNTNKYKVGRCQNAGLSRVRRTLESEGYTELFIQLQPTPNAKNVWNRVKEELKDTNGARILFNKIELRIAPDAFRELVARIDAEKRAI